MMTQQEQENLVSECADIEEKIPYNELEQYAKIKEIVEGLNTYEAERLKQDGFTNECFFNADGSLTEQQKITFKEKKKYFYIDFGTSGAFMIDKTTNSIFGIKAYGQINKAKCWGNVFNIDVEKLHQSRHA